MTNVEARLGEGPVWDATTGLIVWVDILSHKIHHTNPNTGATESLTGPDAVGAVVPTAEGGWVAGLPDGIYSVGSWVRLAAYQDWEGTRSNDGKADAAGNLVQGTMGWNEERGAGRLLRVRPDGSIETLLTDLTISNGLDWTDDGHLLHIDTPTRQVRRFGYSPDKPLEEPDVALDLRGEVGHPDGMCLDSEGCIWVAMWGAGVVRRHTPTGKLDTLIEVPTENVSSCAFGGAHMSTLFITTAHGTDSRPDESSGRLYAVDTATVGKPARLFGG